MGQTVQITPTRPTPDRRARGRRQQARLLPVMFNEDDLNQQQRVTCAFDPAQILNPGKVFPKLHRCAELGRMHIHKGQLRFPDLPRF